MQSSRADAQSDARGVDASPGLFRETHDRSKIAMHLRDARDKSAQGYALNQIASINPFIKPIGNAVKVDVRLDTTPDADLLDKLSKAGLTVKAKFKGLLSGTAKLSSLEAIAQNPHVTSIHPDYGARLNNAGSAPNQADATLRAAIARGTYGVDGTGINIGVLSDSINDVIGGTIAGDCLSGSASQVSGDLPPQVGVLDAGPGGGTDEGAGMAELIRDLCPGSHLAFHTAFNSISDFAQGIIELAGNSGCGYGGSHIICDDVIYYAEPMFQDGEIAQAIDTVVAGGVSYFSSAGNQTDRGIDADYLETTASGHAVHDFTGGDDPFFDVVFAQFGARITVVLQWSQPYSGTLGPGSEIDLDLYLTSSTNNWTKKIVASSTNSQGDTGTPLGDPFEIFTFAAPNPATRYIIIRRIAGSINFRLRVVIFAQGNVSFQSGVLGGPTVYGHSAAAGSMAVAAAYYGEVDSGGSLQGGPEIDVESFSSKGGDLPFYFDGAGNPLPGAPVLRFKPEITSVDGTNTSFFGSPDTDSPPDGFPNFYGTSASAPHAAAIAALMLERAANLGLTPTPAEVYSTMRSSATDIETAGIDAFSGDGLVFADDALGAICIPTVITEQPESQSVCEGNPVTFCVTATGAGPLSYQWKKDGNEISGATASCYTIDPVSAADADSYTCVVSNTCGSAESDPAILTVNVSVGPDFDGDCDVDQDDFDLFQACASGPAIPLTPGCEDRDFDTDNDVDQNDFATFQLCYSGQNIPADPNCAN
ncbi:MAG: S8 family serine peptidase [Planctomycetota bacterium]|nr:MAG: S8 family serine peptidase [Planctomycetota bacterium]